MAKKIALFHAGNAYLPEIKAYQTFFGTQGFEINVFVNKKSTLLDNYDIEWYLMGLDMLPKVKNRPKIHEYISLSLPPFPKLKNCIKQQLNVKPDLRIFHNERIKREFHFSDDLPFLFRDAGIGAHFFEIAAPPIAPKYDFVYLGAMDPTRQLHKLFSNFLQQFSQQTLLVIGEPPAHLKRQFQHPNIHFVGKIPYQTVPFYLRQAQYGINYVPVHYPYYLQPSLKLLEYCAVGLKIITTNYEWVNSFEQHRGGQFFKIQHDWRNFNWAAIQKFDFQTPSVQDLSWNNILRQSGILPFLHSIL